MDISYRASHIVQQLKDVYPDIEISMAMSPDLAFAQSAPKPTAQEKLERALLHAIAMERKAGTRVKRAATLLHRWQRDRRRIEKRIGSAEVQRIINRLTVANDRDAKE